MSRLCSPSVLMVLAIVVFAGSTNLLSPSPKVPARQPCNAYLTEIEWRSYWTDPLVALPVFDDEIRGDGEPLTKYLASLP
jgi:hypothetical protein